MSESGKSDSSSARKARVYNRASVNERNDNNYVEKRIQNVASVRQSRKKAKEKDTSQQKEFARLSRINKLKRQEIGRVKSVIENLNKVIAAHASQPVASSKNLKVIVDQHVKDSSKHKQDVKQAETLTPNEQIGN